MQNWCRRIVFGTALLIFSVSMKQRGSGPLITRRTFLKGIGTATFFGASLAGYAFGVEPFRLNIQRYRVNPPDWPRGLTLRIAAIADVHACNPWMSVERINHIVQTTNALNPDLTVMLGDYTTGHRFVTEQVHSRDWSRAFASLKAPLGVHAVLGNHDWWEDKTAQQRGAGPTFGHLALENVGIAVYENDAIRLTKDGQDFWLAGLGDQAALLPRRGQGRRNWKGVDDLPGTLAKISGDAPIILMAHEPDIFAQMPDRVSLTLSGHTHGGQVRLLGYSPVVPSRYGNRYAYGHIVEPSKEDAGREKHLVVSGGLGCSIMPVRFGMPPEIVVVELGAKSSAAA